jgi:hypothetical protein
MDFILTYKRYIITISILSNSINNKYYIHVSTLVRKKEVYKEQLTLSKATQVTNPNQLATRKALPCLSEMQTD